MTDIKESLKPQPINGHPSGLLHYNKNPKRRALTWFCAIVVAIIVGLITSVFLWYNVQLSPVGGDIGQLTKITISTGTTSSQVGDQLEKMSIIKNSMVFDIYTRLLGKNKILQAGVYRLSPAESVPQIVTHLINGSVDKFNVTFLPGGTLTDAKKILKKAGYSDQEISTAMDANYGGPLFDGRPSSADLEGYIYGETYNFNTGVKVQDILQATFDEFYKQIQDNKSVAAFASHDLNLFQGITLASIIQREASTSQYQRRVAQVFYLRLQTGMVLGSDVTYQYIADKTGIPRSPDINSPYNTRRFPGLTPGPIASPGLTALQAVANPASGDYLFFLAGDDGIMYFAHTAAEHEANVANHCKVNCSAL
jgi:UPF0755 protein